MLWAGSLLIAATGFSLTLIAGAARLDDAVALLFLAMGTLGLVITIRVPGNIVGWLLIGAGLLTAVQTLAVGYADLALIAGVGSRSVGVAAAVISHTLWAPITFLPLILVLLLFPHGRLPSPRWRLVPWMAVMGITGTAIGVTVNDDFPDRSRWGWDVSNPLASELSDALLGAFVLVVISLLAAGLSLLLRYRRASGELKQQIKWVVFGGAMAVILWMVGGMAFDETTVGGILTASALTLLVASIAIAILRYGLYYIDRLISRTVSYALVAGVLAAVYAGGVVGVQAMLPTSDNLGVAGSTLAAAALFNPLRRRVQAMVDRRFNRSRYDARRTVETFASRLSDQVDLVELHEELLSVVGRCLEPAAVSLWLRPVGEQS